jgi:hypothetical protein
MNSTKIKSYKDMIGGYGIETETNYYKRKYLRVNEIQKNKYIQDFGLDTIQKYNTVLDWLIKNFLTK